MEHLYFNFEVKAEPDDEGVFVGMASTFGNKDLVGDVIAPGAFARSLKKRPAKKVKLLFQHEGRGLPLGVFEEIEETEEGLRVKGRLALGTQLGREVFELMKMGALDSLSIGFMADPNKQDIDQERGVRILKEIELMEVSVVTFPANPKARIQRVKSLLDVGETPSVDDFKRHFCDELGLTRRDASAFLAGGYSAFAERRTPGGSDAEFIAAMRQAIAALRRTPTQTGAA